MRLSETEEAVPTVSLLQSSFTDITAMALFHEFPMGNFYLSSKTYTFMRTLLILVFTLLSVPSAAQSRLTIVELNAENLFDTRHDTLKNDYEFLPDSLAIGHVPSTGRS